MIQNEIRIIGHLGADAVKNQGGGKPVINFRVGINDDYKKADGTWENRTQWVECALWADRRMDDLLKGALIAASGTPRIKQYTKKDGTQGASINITIDSLRVLSKPNSGQYSQPPTPGSSIEQSPDSSESPIDDLPF